MTSDQVGHGLFLGDTGEEGAGGGVPDIELSWGGDRIWYFPRVDKHFKWMLDENKVEKCVRVRIGAPDSWRRGQVGCSWASALWWGEEGRTHLEEEEGVGEE